MAATKEKHLVTAIRRAVLEKYPDVWTFKVVGHPYQERGVPDLLVVRDGILLALEVKLRAPGESLEHARGRASADQLRHIAAIRAAGGVAEVVLDVDEALSVLETGVLQSEHDMV